MVHQTYKMQVYDEFVIRENMAVMRCHVPSIVREYVRVVAWLREDQVLVTATHNPRKCSLYSIITSLELSLTLCQFKPCSIDFFLSLAHSAFHLNLIPILTLNYA